MVRITEVQLNNRKISNMDPAIVIAGMNVIESEELCISVAGELKNICERNNVDFIFKASYDKANRSSIDSFRGPGIDQGLKILKTVKDEFNVPIISDIHEPSQAETAAEVLDVIQIPAFLSRQTDLIKAACETEKVINVKKAQFLSPAQMMNIIEKCNHFGNENILLCERGSIFGYDNLIVDFLGIDEIKKIDPKLLKSLFLKIVKKKLIVDVAIELPIRIMGSGAELNSEYVDQDLMSGDRALMKKLKIDQMKLGDLIAINHADHRWGRSYKKDYVSIAICIHGDSVMSGHGPGIMTIMTGKKNDLGWKINKKANIKNLLKIKI